MATYTSKLNLKKPLGTEHVSRQDMNDNYDKIDEGVVLSTDGEISNSLLIGTRESGSTVGDGSFAQGRDVSAAGVQSFSSGRETKATGNQCHAEGFRTTASGYYAHAEGSGTEASGTGAHAEGSGTHALNVGAHAEGETTYAWGNASHAEGHHTSIEGHGSRVAGVWNAIQDKVTQDWVSGTHYVRGNLVKYSDKFYRCKTENSDVSFNSSNWEEMVTSYRMYKFAEIIGNGFSSSNSNARALDWAGNEYLMGDLYVGCNADSTGGTKVPTTPFSGATSSTNGATGLVPAPSAGDQTKFLCADGTWGSVAGASDMTGATASTPGVHGLVPAPAAGDQTKFLSGAGTWEPVGGASDMTGATASTAGVHGLVPAPAAGDQNKVLTGAGTWAALCLKGSLTAISGNGTTTVTLTGLTAAHKVVNWGLFSDSGATTPISQTDAPADITITEGTDSYSITIANFGSAFWIQPVFILPEN